MMEFPSAAQQSSELYTEPLKTASISQSSSISTLNTTSESSPRTCISVACNNKTAKGRKFCSTCYHRKSRNKKNQKAADSGKQIEALTHRCLALMAETEIWRKLAISLRMKERSLVHEMSAFYGRDPLQIEWSPLCFKDSPDAQVVHEMSLMVEDEFLRRSVLALDDPKWTYPNPATVASMAAPSRAQDEYLLTSGDIAAMGKEISRELELKNTSHGTLLDGIVSSLSDSDNVLAFLDDASDDRGETSNYIVGVDRFLNEDIPAYPVSTYEVAFAFDTRYKPFF